MLLLVAYVSSKFCIDLYVRSTETLCDLYFLAGLMLAKVG